MSSAKTTEQERLLKDNNSNKQYDVNEVKRIAAAESEPEKDDKGSTLVIAFLLMLVFQLGNRISGRLVTYPMHNYPVFMTMMSVMVYIPICFAYIIPTMKYTNTITQEQIDIPKYKFAVMGFYDSLAGVMQTFAINYILSSSTIVLVQQSAIPISMLISKYALSAQYSKAQYVGAGVVLLGIVVVLIPTLFNHPSTANAAVAATSSGAGQLFWIGVLVVSCVPMCLSSVYKEKALGEVEIDVVYLNGWVSVYQFYFALLLCIPSSLAIGVPISGIIPNLYGGLKCYMGINTITEASLGVKPDECELAPYFVTTYLALNITYNILTVVILKLGSANILWMASTVIVPVSNVVFSLKFMPGHQPITLFDFIGLVIIMTGLIIYRFMAQLKQVYQRCFNKVSEKDSKARQVENKVSKIAERKSTKYIGLNQVEALNTLIDTRIQKEQQKELYRTTSQIRDNLLVKLGIPPSPLSSRPSPSINNPNPGGPLNFLKLGRAPSSGYAGSSNGNGTKRSFLISPVPPRAPNTGMYRANSNTMQSSQHNSSRGAASSYQGTNTLDRN